MAELKWRYEKLDEHGNVKMLPANDSKGEITGKFIIGLPEYFDEHPEERIRLGWIKHIEKVRTTRPWDLRSTEDVWF